MELQRWSGPDALAQVSARWDALWARSDGADLVSLRASWLLAAQEAYVAPPQQLLVQAVVEGGQWVAAAAWVHHRGVARLLGSGPSDALDLLFDAALPPRGRAEAAALLLGDLRAQAPWLRAVVLRNLPRERGTPALLRALPGWRAVNLRETPSPSLSLEEASSKVLQSRDLRRKERGLARGAALEVISLRDGAAIQGRLEALFALHRRRWDATPTPSLFHDPRHRRFFHALARRLGPEGALRWVELRRDGHPAAIHLGACVRGRYLWYKPAFDPALAAHSPGSVLLARCVAEAVAEGAREFDMGLGGEPYKDRYATHARVVEDLYLSPWRALTARWWLERRARRLARKSLNLLDK